MKTIRKPWKVKVEETKRYDTFTGEPRVETNFFIVDNEKTVAILCNFAQSAQKNANMIAAAPEMLEFLENILKVVEADYADTRIENRANNYFSGILEIVKKAKGENNV